MNFDLPRSELSYFHFWGKADSINNGEPAWHPVAYHSLDVAAVANALLNCNGRRLATIARLLQTTPDNAQRFIVCLIALHDVGKFSKYFQAKSSEAWSSSVGPVLGAWANPPKSRHDADGYDLREALSLRTLFQPATEDWGNSEFNTLWAAITGHHGQPSNDNSRSLAANAGLSPKACRDAAAAFARDARALFDQLNPLPKPDKSSLQILSWLVCGLTVVSDWIGSNREWFPYRAPDRNLQDYWLYAQAQASIAITRAGVVPSKLPPDHSPARILPEIATTLSPLQQCARDMALADGPSLTIVEDVTGSGKTEAAIILAARLMAEGRAGGLFFALPTMATANAMYERLAACYGKLFAADAAPSLVLAHGKRMLNARFTESILQSDAAGDGYPDGGAAVCAAWIADDRRRVFLAEIGIGTIDQALLGVLPSRHQVLRLWGLSDRVLIIDEAHAYDSYMSREMERQLEFHASLGGSAIILSATLPDAQRAKLSAAFARGIGVKHEQADVNDYPLLTHVGGDAVTAMPLASREDRTRTLAVKRVETFETAAEHVSAMAARGAAVAWVRNSVDDAIEAVEDLRRRGHQAVLLHARFAMGDRLDIEAAVCSALGRGGGNRERRGYIVIGTQILEQSLDYDVDAMVTDLAPVDSVIQRAGRLWRHARTGRPVEVPELVVFSPDPESVEDKDWYRKMSARAAAVYGHHGFIWRSAKALFEAGCIETPGGVRALIDQVYGGEGLDGLPEPLVEASKRAVGADSAARSFANANLLSVFDGYGGNSQLWTADTITPTRLGQAVTVFRLGKISDGKIVPWCEDENPARAWALSEVSLNRKRATGVPTAISEHAALIAAAKNDWPEWDHDLPLLLLEPHGDIWRGSVVKSGDVLSALYCNRIGLRIAT